MRLAYAMDMRRQVHLPLPPATAAAARALPIVSICLAYVFSMTNLVSPNWGWGSGSGLYSSMSVCVLWAYTKHMLTIVVAEGAGVHGAGHLRIVKVRDREVAHGERRQGVCENEIQVSMLP